ncbi:MAG: glycerophosphodiester phosphodiesterase [Nocardioidaceae bacterium]|nr:glycerophosphodiester phosphodiesterase [Nocardioidaceae bacterium]
MHPRRLSRPRRRLAALGIGIVSGVTALSPVAASTAAHAGEAPVTLTVSTADDHDPAVGSTLAGRSPIVIGHRGAPGYRPEHTLASYKLAIQLGADFIEPDLVSTKDGVLVSRHENEISGTTDVSEHPEFADRRTTKIIDGVPLTGWFTEDFTLAELKTLRAVERLPDVRPDNTRYNGRFEIPTFDEILELVKQQSVSQGRKIGVYPETKHPTYFRSIGLRLERRMLRDLRQAGLAYAPRRVFIQSFETRNLRRLNHLTGLPLIQLIDSKGAPYDLKAAGDPRTYADLVTPDGLREIATYADGIGPNKDIVIPRDQNGFLLDPSPVVSRAHHFGLLVHVFTFRDENQFLPADFRIGTDPNAKGDAFSEYETFFDLGIDGVFTDYTDTAVAARDWYYDESTDKQAS